MKHHLLLCAALALGLTARAQQTPFARYELPSEGFNHVYLDLVAAFPVRSITMGDDQFVGQTDPNGRIYGYGRYVRSDGTQIVGQFRNGELLFGITLGQHSALVGQPKYYSSYSLTTGRLEYVYHSSTRQLLDTKALGEYAFVSMSYANGDQYMGETYQGRRHGYGIYYYANGDFWFGEYDKDVRQGFGALFKTDNTLVIGQWDGEDQRRTMKLKAKDEKGKVKS